MNILFWICLSQSVFWYLLGMTIPNDLKNALTNLEETGDNRYLLKAKGSLKRLRRLAIVSGLWLLACFIFGGIWWYSS